ncbi:integrase [Dolichospermum sp. UHCC 0406]|uniref:integrase n=1 Tax=Dolichospermum sp. UHCC 0406 TaxID=2590017 RepID=UPI00157FFFF0|nr:integrase [Dolichospermum sp. UHCC 0406]
MDSKWTIEEVNARLKAGKIGVAVCQRGDKLSLRATFPPKSGTGKPHQQYLALGCYANPAGLQFAEAEAKKVGGLLAQGRFEWSEYLDQGLQSAPISSAKNWIQKFEVDYYSRRGKSPTTETTWKSDYLPAWRLLGDELTPEAMLAAVAQVPANTRKRKLVCEKLIALAKFAGQPIDLKPYIGSYGIGETTPRYIPSRKEIEANRELLKNHWQWAYGILATYGLRPHEVFFCEISPEHPYLLKVLRGKTGYREVYPYHLDWAKNWELWRQQELPCTAPTLKEYGQRVTKAFSRANIPFTAYCLRHAYCIRLSTEYKIPVAIAKRCCKQFAASWAGHEPGVYLKTRGNASNFF